MPLAPVSSMSLIAEGPEVKVRDAAGSNSQSFGQSLDDLW